MRNKILLAIVVLLMCSCTYKRTSVEFTVKSDDEGKGALILLSEGFDFDTLTEQSADGGEPNISIIPPVVP
jgi:hypothetical protein